jgi:hypothetical protein
MEKVILKKPFTWENETVTEVSLNFDALTGESMAQAQRECNAMGRNPGAFPEGDKTYLAHIAGYACKKPVDYILALPIRDFAQVTVAVQNFLLG